MQALFNLFDGVPRSFDNKMDQAFEALYHQEFIHNMDGKPMNKAQWKERLTALAETGTRIILLKFEPKDEVHYEAGIRVINENIDVVRYPRGTISGSMLLKMEPRESSVQKVVSSEEHACSVDKYGDLGSRGVTANVRYHLPATGGN